VRQSGRENVRVGAVRASEGVDAEKDRALLDALGTVFAAAMKGVAWLRQVVARLSTTA